MYNFRETAGRPASRQILAPAVRAPRRCRRELRSPSGVGNRGHVPCHARGEPVDKAPENGARPVRRKGQAEDVTDPARLKTREGVGARRREGGEELVATAMKG